MDLGQRVVMDEVGDREGDNAGVVVESEQDLNESGEKKVLNSNQSKKSLRWKENHELDLIKVVKGKQKLYLKIFINFFLGAELCDPIHLVAMSNPAPV